MEYSKHDDLVELRTIFDLADSNRDGVIDKQELKMMLSILGIQSNEEEIEQFFKSLDTDKDNSIQFNEFYVALSKKAEGFDREELIKAFAVLSDGKTPGRISKQDLLGTLIIVGKMPQHEADAIIEQLELDHNDQFNYEEYVRLLTYTK